MRPMLPFYDYSRQKGLLGHNNNNRNNIIIIIIIIITMMIIIILFQSCFVSAC